MTPNGEKPMAWKWDKTGQTELSAMDGNSPTDHHATPNPARRVGGSGLYG